MNNWKYSNNSYSSNDQYTIYYCYWIMLSIVCRKVQSSLKNIFCVYVLARVKSLRKIWGTDRARHIFFHAIIFSKVIGYNLKLTNISRKKEALSVTYMFHCLHPAFFPFVDSVFALWASSVTILCVFLWTLPPAFLYYLCNYESLIHYILSFNLQ